MYSEMLNVQYNVQQTTKYCQSAGAQLANNLVTNVRVQQPTYVRLAQ